MSKTNKNNLISIGLLSDISGTMNYESIKKMISRGKFTKIVRLTKAEALKLGLDWKGKGGGDKLGQRPFIDITDPAIPQEVREKYYESLIKNGNKLQPSTLRADRSKPPHPITDPLASSESKNKVPLVGRSTDQKPAVSETARQHHSPFDVCSGREPSTPARNNPETEIGAPVPPPARAEEYMTENELEFLIYSRAPEYQKRSADKYLPLIKETLQMRGLS